MEMCGLQCYKHCYQRVSVALASLILVNVEVAIRCISDNSRFGHVQHSIYIRSRIFLI